jgi:hypothetical protein
MLTSGDSGTYGGTLTGVEEGSTASPSSGQPSPTPNTGAIAPGTGYPAVVTPPGFSVPVPVDPEGKVITPDPALRSDPLGWLEMQRLLNELLSDLAPREGNRKVEPPPRGVDPDSEENQGQVDPLNDPDVAAALGIAPAASAAPDPLSDPGVAGGLGISAPAPDAPAPAPDGPIGEGEI